MSPGAMAQVPDCQRVATGAMVPCWDVIKIEKARAILAKRGIRVGHDYVVSIEMNRGKFRDAKALAHWIEWGG